MYVLDYQVLGNLMWAQIISAMTFLTFMYPRGEKAEVKRIAWSAQLLNA